MQTQSYTTRRGPRKPDHPVAIDDLDPTRQRNALTLRALIKHVGPLVFDPRNDASFRAVADLAAAGMVKLRADIAYGHLVYRVEVCQ